MAKLTFTEKEIAAEFKTEIAEMGGEIFYNEYNGVSAVILPNDNMDGFVRVYLTHCSPNDKFSKKRARLVLRERVYNDNYILFPAFGGDYQFVADWIIGIE